MAVALASIGQATSGGFAPARVGVVDVPAVSERYLKTTELENHFELRRVKLSEQPDALREKIDRTARSLREEFKPGTNEFQERSKQLAMLEAELQWFVEEQGRQIEQELAGSLRLIFDDIRDVVGELAEQKGIDVVLAADRIPEGAPATTTQARQQIILQKVLYWRPSVDLTDDVVARLNARFEAQRPSPASGPG
jgi:Skp family chaperone for outer membrane proteins